MLAKLHTFALVGIDAVLVEAVGILSGWLAAEPMSAGVEELLEGLSQYPVDFSDVRGQEFAKRALVVSASGGHNVLSF